MSRTIDERVVSMQFDNKQFEKDAQTSLGTLAKLKQSLNFTGASKGLENVNAAAKSFSLSPVGNAVETVKMKFSALEVMAVTALANITNSAVNAGKRIASSLTIEPVKTGFKEYETQIGAVQTILANTQSKGSTLDDVNAALDELNLYADKTIYNFTEMTRNIGTFTAAGVDLDKSVQSIKGIANLAAISGSTSQQASTAMYQLSQALAAGKVQLMDWNSVVNAGMGGQVFQDALKRTAKNFGHNVDEMIKKYGSFRESLTKGEWLTAEVLTETLAQLSGAYTEADLISQGYTKEQAKEILELSKTAESAATDVKTFTQLMDTLKESAQSGWTSTWELIIGDFEEAKQLWSSIYKVFGGMIEASSNARNKLLGGALDSNWDKLTKKINDAGVQTTVFENKIKDVAKSHKIDIDKIVKEYGSLKKAFQEGAISTDILKEAVNELGGSMVDLEGVRKGLKMGDTGEDVKKVQQALKDLGYNLNKFGVDGIVGEETTAAIKAFQEAAGLKVTGIIDDETLKALGEGNNKLVDLKSSMGSLIDEVDKLGGRDLLIASFKNIFEGLMDILKPIKKAFETIFPPMTSERLYDLIKGFHDLTAGFKLNEKQARNIRNTFKGVFAVFDIAWTFVKKLAGGIWDLLGNFSGLGDGVLSVTGTIGKWLVALRNAIKTGDAIGFVVERVSGFIKNCIDVIKPIGAAIKDGFIHYFQLAIDKIVQFAKTFKKSIDDAGGFVKAFKLDGLIDYISGAWKKIKEFFVNLKNIGKSVEGGDGTSRIQALIEAVKTFKDNIVGYFEEAGNPFKHLSEFVTNFRDNVVKYFGEAGIKFDDIRSKISGFIDLVKKKLGENMGTILAIGTLVTFLFLVKKIKDAVELIAKPFDMVEGFLEGLGDSIKSFANSAKASAKGKLIEGIAISIAILAASVAVLAMMDQGKVWSSVGVIVALAAVMTTMAILLGKFEIGDFGKLSVSLLGLSGSLVVFAIAAKMMGSVDWGALAKCGAVIVGLVVAIGIMSKMKVQPYVFEEFAKMMLKLSAGLLILGLAVKILGSMDSNVLLQGGTAVVAFMGMMVGMMAATKFLGTQLPKFGTTMAGLAVSLLLMSASIAILGRMDMATLIQGGVAVAAFFALMVIMMASTRLLAKDMPRFGATMFGLSAAMLLMAGTVFILGNMDMGTAIKGAIAMIAFIGLMSLMMLATRALSKHLGNAIKIGAMMLAFSASILILVGAVALLSMITEADMDKAISAIGKLAVVFSVLMIASKYAGDCKGPVMAMSVAIAVLAVAVAALSFVAKDGPEALNQATRTIVILVGMFAILAASTKNVTKSMGSLIVLVGAIAILAGVVILLSDIPVEDSLPVIAAMSFMIISLSAACKLLAMIPIMGAVMAMANLAVMIGLLTVIVIAVGGIYKIPGAKELMADGGAFLELLGLAIGRFVGGIVGGFGAGLTAGLPEIGENLSTFMEKLQPFIDAVSGLDEKTISGVEALAAMLISLTASRFLDAITSWLTGGSSLADFAAGLVPFGEKIVEFSNVISVIGDDAITKMGKVSEVIDTLVAIADKVPKSGGLVQAISGTPDLVAFATGLESIGGAMVTFNTNVSGISDESITKMTNIATVIEKLVEIAGKVPETGGLEQAITGTPDMATFATNLGTLGTSIITFRDSIAALSEEDIARLSAIAPAIEALASIAEAVPESGGLKQKIEGIPDFNSFTESIATLGTKVVEFSTSVSALTDEDIAKITSIGTAVDNLVTLSTKIPATDGIKQAITGAPSLSTFAGQMATFGGKVAEFAGSVKEVSEEDIAKMTSIGTAAKTLVGVATSLKDYNDSVVWNTNLTEFATQLKDFGTKMAEFEGEIKDIDRSVLTGIASSARTLMRLAQDLNDLDTTGLGDFSGELYWFGDGLKDLYADLSDVDTGKLSTAVASINTILSIAKEVDSVNFDGLSAFGTSLEKIGKAGIDGFIKAFGDAKDRVAKAGGEMLNNLKKGASDKLNSLIEAFESMVSKAVTAVREKYNSFYNAGKYLVEGFASGITDKTFKAEAKAKAMAEAAVEAARKALKINSPSKVMIPLGEGIPEGLIVGIDNLAGNVKNSAVGMARSAIDGAKNAMARIAEVINSDVDSQPTIRPVVDLSAVSAGAGAINGMFNMSPSVGVMSNVNSISSMMSGRQNGGNDDVISAIEKLGKSLGDMRGDTYSINGVTYDDGSNISEAVKSLVRAARVERRI